MAQQKKTRSAQTAALKKAGRAITDLRQTVGLPNRPLARKIATKIRELSKEKKILIEWDIRVLRPGESVEAVCNCHCYA
jgi:hypothetical protein